MQLEAALEERKYLPALVKHIPGSIKKLCQSGTGQPQPPDPTPSSGFASVVPYQVLFPTSQGVLVSRAPPAMTRGKGLGMVFSFSYNLYLETTLFTKVYKVSLYGSHQVKSNTERSLHAALAPCMHCCRDQELSLHIG